MDSDELRSILSRSRIGVFELIDTAIRVAGSDDGDELLRRRDRIIESLYTAAPQLCRNCNDVVQGSYVQNTDINTNVDDDDDEEDDRKRKNEYTGNDRNRNLKEDFVSKSPLTPESNHRSCSEDEVDPFGALFDYEQSKIVSIKEQLEDPDQSEDDVIELLQSLADMDIDFQALQETDIGRHVNRLRKHSSNEVRRLVKQLVRKWKETVDEWVKVNQPQGNSNLIADGDSPQQNIPKNQQNGHHQVPDFWHSPNPQNGSSSAERNHAEHETKHKPIQTAPRREAPSRPPQSLPKYTSAPPNRTARESALDDDRLNSARKRLQENYQEAQNAKKQRKIQVMDIHELPKPKNGFFAKNKGGFQGRNHR